MLSLASQNKLQGSLVNGPLMEPVLSVQLGAGCAWAACSSELALRVLGLASPQLSPRGQPSSSSDSDKCELNGTALVVR